MAPRGPRCRGCGLFRRRAHRRRRGCGRHVRGPQGPWSKGGCGSQRGGYSADGDRPRAGSGARKEAVKNAGSLLTAFLKDEAVRETASSVLEEFAEGARQGVPVAILAAALVVLLADLLRARVAWH